MLIQEDSLGGRLALLQPSELDSDQETFHARLIDKIMPWAEESGFQAETSEGNVIGPFNPMLRSPNLSNASLDLLQTEQEHTSLSKKVREVVILSVGAVWKSAYELYAHNAVAKKVGLSQQSIDFLVTGQPSDTCPPKSAWPTRSPTVWSPNIR